MPVYEYICINNHTHLEKRSIHEEQIQTNCPTCGSVLKQNYNAPLIQLKGSGFYRNSKR